MNLRWILAIALWILAVVRPPELRTQTNGPVIEARRWELTAHLGRPYGGPTDQLEDAMRAAGLDDPSGTVEHPFSSGPEVSWALSIRRRLWPAWEAEVLMARAATGSTLGHAELLRFLFLEHTVTTVAPILSFRIANLHVGAGPSANRIRVERTDSGPAQDLEAWEPGFLIDAGVTIPRRSRLFFEMRGQYRWIPHVDVGPYAIRNTFPDDIPLSMPPTRIDMSHSMVLVGVGVRT